MSNSFPLVFITSRTVRSWSTCIPMVSSCWALLLLGSTSGATTTFFNFICLPRGISLAPSWRTVLLANFDAAAFTMSSACECERVPYDSAGRANSCDGLPALASLKDSFAVGNFLLQSVFLLRTHRIDEHWPLHQQIGSPYSSYCSLHSSFLSTAASTHLPPSCCGLW